MKLSIRTEELSKALYRVQGIAEKKSTIPILAHVLLEASDDNQLTVSATDLDVGLTGIYDAEVQVRGSVAVQARQLFEIVKAMRGEQIELQREDNNWIQLRCGKSKFRLVGMPADEFPSLPSHTEIETFEIPADDLAGMIERTIFCVSTDDNRHNLSGVYCEVREGNTLRLVATDGHRLALADKQFETPLPIANGVIVPRKGFQELRRVLNDSEGLTHVEMGFAGNSGVLKAGSVVLSTRLVEGQFPEYEQVIPKGGGSKAFLPRAPFAEALRRVSLLSQSRAHGVKMQFDANKLDLTAEDPEIGTATESVDIEYDGPTMTIGFNARYVLDVMALMQGDKICFSLLDSLSPGVITPYDNSGFLAVVMPMRI